MQVVQGIDFDVCSKQPSLFGADEEAGPNRGFDIGEDGMGDAEGEQGAPKSDAQGEFDLGIQSPDGEEK